MAYLIEVTGVPYDIKHGEFRIRLGNIVYVYKSCNNQQLSMAAEAARIGAEVTVEHDAIGTYVRPIWANNRIEAWIIVESNYINVKRRIE